MNALHVGSCELPTKNCLVRNVMKTRSKRALLWRIAFMTFFLSAILDNLTTSIVMIMILRKLVRDRKDRIIYASLVIIAANSGGAFTPIGDVTTIMLWNKGVITALGVISELLVPSVISMVIPAYVLSLSLKGQLTFTTEQPRTVQASDLTAMQRKIIFFLGVGGLIFVPIFKSITLLPPFVGILLVLGVLWTVTEVFYAHLKAPEEKGAMQKRVAQMLFAGAAMVERFEWVLGLFGLPPECASHRSFHTTQPGSNLWCPLIFNVVFRSGNAQ